MVDSSQFWPEGKRIAVAFNVQAGGPLGAKGLGANPAVICRLQGRNRIRCREHSVTTAAAHTNDCDHRDCCG